MKISPLFNVTRRIMPFVFLGLAIGYSVADEARESKKTSSAVKEKGSRKSSQDKEKSSKYQFTNANVVHRQEVYKSIGDINLSIDIFEPKEKQPNQKYPAIVFFFGGGWVGGTPSQFYPHCEYLADRGMIAMAADYRVNTRNKTTPAECVKDGKSAVRWIRANAERLGIDPTRIAAGGGSAGGHVAAAVATTVGFEEDGEDASRSCLPNALVLFNPVYDNGPKGYGHERVKSFFPAISPFHNLRPGTPPTIVFLGTNDKLIPASTAQAYQAKMKENGDRSELFLYEGQPHGFFNYREDSKRFYYQTLYESDKFLASLGWIQGEPKIAPDLLK